MALLAFVLAFALIPATGLAAIPGAYYSVAVWPDVPGSFASPTGMAVNAAGDVYVADTSNCRIKRMSPAGAVLGVWGSRGTGNGQFSDPEGIAVLPSGRVVVADTGNDRLQLFEADGTFVAVWGAHGTAAGQFDAPAGLAVGPTGDVFVADAANARIQRLNSSGAWVATIGAAGPGAGQLDNPRGVAVDGVGNIYVADTNNYRIQKFTAAGAYSTQWGPVEVGGITYSRYSMPYGVAIDSTGNLLVVDAGGIKYTPSDPASAKYYVERCYVAGTAYAVGTVLSQWGTSGSGSGQYLTPRGVAKRPSGGAYVADSGNNRVQVLSSAGTVDAIWSGRGSATGLLDAPEGVALDSAGNAYVADTGNDRVQVFDSAGAFVRTWGTSGSAVGKLDAPTDIALAGDGTVWVVEKANSRVQAFSSTGTPLAVVGAPGTGNGQFSSPEGIALDGSGNIFVADTGNARVQKFTSAGVFQQVIGVGKLTAPTDVAVDGSGNLYVADRTASRVQVFDPAGTYVRTIGAYGVNQGEFVQPTGVALNGSGSLFVADSGNARVQRFTTSGVFETTFGTFGGSKGEMAWPSRVAVDSTGRPLVVERDNHRLQLWAYDGTAPTTAISGFTNYGSYNSTLTVTLSATDAASGIAATYYQVYVNSVAGAVQTYAGPFSLATEGSLRVKYWSVDRSGNTETAKNAYVTIDMTPPSGTFVLAGGAAYVNTTTVTAASSFTDATQMRFNTGAGYADWQTYAASYQLTLVGEGTHTVYAQYQDTLYNTSTYSDTITVDLTPPATSATGVPTGWTNVAPTITLTAVDGASGVAHKYYRIGPAGATNEYTAPFTVTTEGGVDVYYWSVDAVGNIEPARSVAVYYDITPPTGTMQLAAGVSVVDTTTVTLASDVPDAIDMSVDTGGGYGAWAAYAASRQVVLAGEGAHTVNARYRDRAGNILTLSDGISVDLSAPVTTPSGIPSGWSRTPVTVSLAAVDSISGVAGTYYAIGSGSAQPYTDPFTVSAEGETVVTYWSVDNLGHAEEPHEARVKVDATVPSTEATGVPVGWVNTPVSVSLIATDALSGVASTHYRIGTGAEHLYAGAFPVTLQGATDVTYWSVDAAGNTEPAHVVTVYYDTVPPSGTMALAGGAARIATTTVAVDSAVPDAVDMRIDPGMGYGNWQAYAASTVATLSGSGDNTVTVEYRDRAGNTLELSDSVFVDLSSPVTQISGVPADWTSADVTITLSAEDADTAVYATYYRLGSSDATTYTAPFPITAEGETTIEFWSVDLLGNTEAPQYATVRIDRTPPSGRMTVAGGAVLFASRTLPVSSAVVGASEMRVDIGGGYGAWGPFEAALAVVVPADGAYTVRVQYRDAAQNLLSLTSQQVTVDTLAPSVTGVVVTVDSWRRPKHPTGTLVVRWTASDANGVSGYSWSIDRTAGTTPDTTVDLAGTTLNTTVANAGTYYLHVRARDAAGNWGPASHVRFVVTVNRTRGRVFK